MIFVRKRTKCKNSRLINGKSLETRLLKGSGDGSVGCLLPVLSDSVCMIHRALSRRRVNSGCVRAESLSCTRSTPFICTSHAYRKRNKVYTQCCWCIFLIHSHQQKYLRALWRVQALLLVCFLNVGVEVYSCGLLLPDFHCLLD